MADIANTTMADIANTAKAQKLKLANSRKKVPFTYLSSNLILIFNFSLKNYKN